MTTETAVIVVGAGPSGLATAACLAQNSIPYVVLEREDCIASLWKKKAYDRLHLHLTKPFCQLPHSPLPEDLPPYVSRADFVRYLDDYALRFRIAPLFNRTVTLASSSRDLLCAVQQSHALVTVSGSRSRGRSQTRGSFVCYHCGKEGHMKRNCNVWKKKREEEENQKGTTSVLQDSDDEQVVLTCLEEPDSCVEWIDDGAASFHATSRRKAFTSYRVGRFGKAKMGNGSLSDIVGMGDVCVTTNTGCRMTLTDVRHIPDL